MSLRDVASDETCQCDLYRFKIRPDCNCTTQQHASSMSKSAADLSESKWTVLTYKYTHGLL